MKIGIMTFHWATNYGAVLQAYALREFLEKRYKAEVTIIHYKPAQYDLRLIDKSNFFHPKKAVYTYKELKREKKMEPFRDSNLKLTRRYYSESELKASCCDYDILISGSDQIWNTFFTSAGEGGRSFAYYLSFGGEGCRRIAYAASFGCVAYPQKLADEIKPYLLRYNNLGVRESTAVKILSDMGMDSVQLNADPTLLLEKNDYEQLFAANSAPGGYCAAYFLRDSPSQIRKKLALCKSRGIAAGKIVTIKDETVGGWLSTIAGCRCLVTNSYHGTVFAVLFQREFYVFPEKGGNAGMNDRITTLLDTLGLSDRIVKEDSFSPAAPVDWEDVARRLDAYREKSIHYLDTAVRGE